LPSTCSGGWGRGGRQRRRKGVKPRSRPRFLILA
jgi:hypothetical protein